MNSPAVVGRLERGVRPRAWLCELAQADGTTRTQFVEQDPDGLRWNDAGEPSPYRTTPLYEAPHWVAVSERMPAAGCKVLVFYRNSYGRARRTCAHYSPLHTVDASAWDEGEPDETEDGTFEPEGWWEEPVEMERVEFITDEVTHWMPLPEPPPLPVAGPNVKWTQPPKNEDTMSDITDLLRRADNGDKLTLAEQLRMAAANYVYPGKTRVSLCAEAADALDEALRRAHAAEAELEALKRGEFICTSCGLRKDADVSSASF